MTSSLATMNLNLLVALDALLAERSVTRAARHIAVSQSAMSQSLASLRAMLGDQLLVRRGNEMHLTTRAESLGPPLRRCLDELGRVLTTGQSFEPAAQRGTIRIATAEHLAALLAPPLLQRMQAGAPHVDLRIDTLDARRTGELLDTGAADLVIGPPIDASAVDSHHLFDDAYVCVVRARDAPSSRRATLSMRAFLARGHVLISPSGRGQSVVDRVLAERGASRRVVARVGSFLLAPLVVARTNLVLTAPRACLAPVTRALALKTLRCPLPLPPQTIACHWARRRGDEPALRWLRGLVESSFADAGVV